MYYYYHIVICVLRRFFSRVCTKTKDAMISLFYIIAGFILNCLSMFRFALYKFISAIASISRLAFIVSFYFIYKLVGELQNGISFSKTQNGLISIYLFVIPLVLAITEEILRPKNIDE